MNGWILLSAVGAITVAGCSASSPDAQTPNDVLNALSAAEVKCDSPAIDGPRPLSEVYQDANKPPSTTQDTDALWSEMSKIPGTWTRIGCTAGNRENDTYFVIISPQAALNADCAYMQRVIRDRWGVASEDEKQEYRDGSAVQAVVGDGWVAKPYNNANLWPALAQPGDVARALRGSVVTNACGIELPE